MQSVKVRRSGMSVDQAAEVLRQELGAQYQVRTEGEATLIVSKGFERAKVSLGAEPGGTVFEVSGDGATVFPLFNVITKMVNDRGIAKRTAAVIGEAKGFRDDG